MKEFNRSTEIGKLQEPGGKKEKKHEESKDKEDMACVRIVNEIMGITGR